jgi:molybdopterin-containing oxidoreductase family iron-sulfur binding subunit
MTKKLSSNPAARGGCAGGTPERDSTERRAKPAAVLKGADPGRRKFIHRALVAVGGMGLLGHLAAKTAPAAESVPEAKPLDHPEGSADGNALERMRVELLKALKKPVRDRKWVMVIDLQKCIGCKACTVSCCVENNLPPGVVYRPVPEQEVGEYPDVRLVFTPRPCMQCDNPPCVPACPVTATWKQEDGVVVIDYDVCIGCRNCLAACPYNARTADFGEFYGASTPAIMDYETRPNYEYSTPWRRDPHKERSPIGNARKCHFCLHRIREGMLPACVTTCLGGATYFGDYNDRYGLAHELIGSSRVKRLKEDLGTNPSVYYLA